MSIEGGSPESSSAISFPVMGAMLSPIMACPVATDRFSNRSKRPT